MKRQILIIFLIVLFASCKKDEQGQPIVQPPAQTHPPAQSPTGIATFYIDPAAQPEDWFYYGFKLYINNQHIADWNTHTTYEPNCGSWYAVNYSDTAGTYTMRAEKLSTSPPNHNWTSTFTITKEWCTKIGLKNQ